MINALTENLSRIFSPELVVLSVAALPVSELRGSIPLAIGVFHFSIQKAYIISIIGNLIPVLPILLLLESTSKYLSEKFSWANKFFNWLFTRTRKKSKIVEKYGALGLILFVAIPLPVTGAWTGCVAAFLLGMPKLKAFLAVLLGVMIAGVVVSLATMGIINLPALFRTAASG